MKYFLLASLLCLFQQQPKRYSAEFTMQEWNQKITNINTANYYIGRSLTVDQAQQLKDSLTSVVESLITQINIQVKADSSNARNKK